MTNEKNINIDISSTALEGGVEVAKNFVDKLVMPPIEELGLLMRDKISYWRFCNQVKILNKAKTICEKNNISVKAISPKLLCPYLENASLEDDEDLQEKWAILLANMADSKQNIQNQVFPYILSQLSKEEFPLLENVFNKKKNRISKINEEINEFIKTRPIIEQKLKSEIEELDAKLRNISTSNVSNRYHESYQIRSKKDDIERQLKYLPHKESSFKRRIEAPQQIPENIMKEFELANIVRLGLAKVVYEVTAGSQKIEIPSTERDRYVSVDFDIDIETNTSTILTELGELFIEACQERSQNI